MNFKPEAKVREYSQVRSLELFRKYLETRKEEIREDLDELFNHIVQRRAKQQLSEEEKEKIKQCLIKLKKRIRDYFAETIGYENLEFVSTTIHFRPRAIDSLILGENRITQATQGIGKFFHYPVYYQKFDTERPYIIEIGDVKIPLFDIIPSLKGRKFEISLDFHEALMEYLITTENWREEIRENLKDYISRYFSDSTKDEREALQTYVSEVIISILDDYKKYFEEDYNKSSLNRLDNKERILSFNADLASIFLEVYDDLKEIFEDLNISKENLESLVKKDEKTFAFGFDLFSLVLLFGNFVHIGAEYGKLNNLRMKIGLKQLTEPEFPQERFSLLEDSKKYESGTLRFLFGNLLPLNQVAKYMGYEGGFFSPINRELLKRVRIVDFVLKIKNLDQNSFFNISLSKDSFRELLVLIDYFSYLTEEEKDKVKSLLEGLPGDGGKSLNEWILTYNKSLSGEKEGVNRFMLRKNVLWEKWRDYLLKLYLEDPLKLLEFRINELAPFLKNHFEKSFLENIDINDKTFPLKGLVIPLILPSLSKKDLVLISYFFKKWGIS
jgi:hypothetical protein